MVSIFQNLFVIKKKKKLKKKKEITFILFPELILLTINSGFVLLGKPKHKIGN